MHKLMRKLLGTVLLVGGLSTGAAAAEVWRAELGVSITASKGSESITYTVSVRNNGDDSARDNVISITPTEGLLQGMSLVSITSGPSMCTHQVVNNSVISVKCTLAILNTSATETITVVVTNPGNLKRTGSAQAMGIAPDPIPGNNYAAVVVP